MLEGDSIDYEVITKAIQTIPNTLEGLTCEIGIRRGGGTKYIIDALAKSSLPYKVHIGIDPYGRLEYKWLEGVTCRMDYTNTMRDESISNIYQYANKKEVNFIFINLTDIEFFKRYSDGVPFYEEEEYLLNEYVFTHFDGPHQLNALIPEFLWFNNRMRSGATIVFDDVTFYDFEAMHPIVIKHGWKMLKITTQKKAAYQKL